MITVTFVRHGESEDNLKEIWAGWKDAPLSELGRQQAAAAAKYFSTTRLDYIYVSPSLRARSTGEAIHASQSHNPPFEVNPKLREQHFGIAEGRKWAATLPHGMTPEQAAVEGIFPTLHGRQDKFPEGESLEDLSRRATDAARECILPHLHKEGVHIAIASHGLCIFEMLVCLLRLDPDSQRYRTLKGLVNTGWVRVTISVKNEHDGPIDPANPPPLDVIVTDINRMDHLAEIPAAREKATQEQELKRQYFGGNRL